MDLYEVLTAETTRRLEGWRDLEQFGIRILTGEACAYGMRVLCDLTEEGLRHVENFFSVLCPNENWNSSAVKSVLLPRSLFIDLAAFVLLETGSEVVVRLESMQPGFGNPGACSA